MPYRCSRAPLASGAAAQDTDRQVEEVITKTLEGAPKGATHWSTLCVLALVGLIGIAPLHAYNLARVHRTLKTTPAMAAGVADHKPTLGEIAALLD